MRVAPYHDGGALGHPQIALAQINAFTFGQLGQLFDRAVVSLASVGCAIAFSWTVVSTTTRSSSLLSIAPVRCATDRLSCKRSYRPKLVTAGIGKAAYRGGA
jgi:hypothetical protein